MQPRIFISSVFSEFSTTRHSVANRLKRLAYDPVWYDIFSTPSGDLLQVLREKIDGCDGLIQLVGHAYGAEPPTLGTEFAQDGFLRLSYTQFEFLYARARGKKTWLIYTYDERTGDCWEGQVYSSRDSQHSDRTERRALQEAWRQRWMHESHLLHGDISDTDLELEIERLREVYYRLRIETTTEPGPPRSMSARAKNRASRWWPKIEWPWKRRHHQTSMELPPSASLPAAMMLPTQYQSECTSRDSCLTLDPRNASVTQDETDATSCMAESRVPQAASLDVTAFAPPTVRYGEEFILQLFVHSAEQAKYVENIAKEFDSASGARSSSSLWEGIAGGAKLEFQLQLRHGTANTSLAKLRWSGRPQAVQFLVTANTRQSHDALFGTVTVNCDSVPIGQLSFKVILTTSVEKMSPECVGIADRFSQFFISYASKDRAEVVKRVQMLSRLGKAFRQDFLDLDPGDRWERKIYEFIRECDATLLFWSSNAKASEWVMRECRFCIEHKGVDRLLPVIIEFPPPLPPPEFAELHMNDRLLAFVE